MTDFRTTLAQIVAFADDVAAAVARGRRACETDPFVRSHLLHSLTLLGEAVRRKREELPERMPNVPWEQVIGLRNVIVHGYDAIDRERVWTIVTQAVPTLRADVARLLAEHDRNVGE